MGLLPAPHEEKTCCAHRECPPTPPHPRPGLSPAPPDSPLPSTVEALLQGHCQDSPRRGFPSGDGPDPGPGGETFVLGAEKTPCPPENAGEKATDSSASRAGEGCTVRGRGRHGEQAWPPGPTCPCVDGGAPPGGTVAPHVAGLSLLQRCSGFPRWRTVSARAGRVGRPRITNRKHHVHANPCMGCHGHCHAITCGAVTFGGGKIRAWRCDPTLAEI